MAKNVLILMGSPRKKATQASSATNSNAAQKKPDMLWKRSMWPL